MGEAHVSTTLMKQVFYITKRKWEPNIQHDCKSDDFRARFKVAKWRVFCHWAWLQISPARFKLVYSDKAWENGYCESFNARFRNELLNGELLYTLR